MKDFSVRCILVHKKWFIYTTSKLAYQLKPILQYQVPARVSGFGQRNFSVCRPVAANLLLTFTQERKKDKLIHSYIFAMHLSFFHANCEKSNDNNIEPLQSSVGYNHLVKIVNGILMSSRWLSSFMFCWLPPKCRQPADIEAMAQPFSWWQLPINSFAHVHNSLLVWFSGVLNSCW